jgi:hypothetical protein
MGDRGLRRWQDSAPSAIVTLTKEARMTELQRTSSEEARRVGDAIGVDWDRFDLEQFRAGMDVEYEHGSHDPQTDVTGNDPVVTGKIALAHLKEFPDYYERLELMERQAEAEKSGKPARST